MKRARVSSRAMRLPQHLPSPFETLSKSRQWAKRRDGKITLTDANLVTAITQNGDRAQACLPPIGTATRSRVFDLAVARLSARPGMRKKSVAFYVGGLLVLLHDAGTVILFAGEALSVGVLRETAESATV